MVRARLKEVDLDRVIIIQRLKDRLMTQVEAASQLGICERQIRRLLKRVESGGFEELAPKYHGGNRSFSAEVKLRMIAVVKEKYADFGPTFAAEKLESSEGLKVSKETLRKWMIEVGLWKGRSRKKARIHQSRERRSRFGELVQIDGSPHDWFEGRAPKCCLLVMIDDATSRLIFMRFEASETTFGYMRCINSHLKRYGRPVAYYSDRHSIFKTTREQCVDGIHQDTHLHRALKDLKIDLICANSPQAKGRVERANSTLQDRLIKEMRLKGISNIDDANVYLQEFISLYNRKFSVEPTNAEDAHRPLIHSQAQMELILSKQETRKVTKNLEFSWKGKICQIQGVGNGYRLQQAHITVYETMAGKMKVMYDGKPLQFKVVERLIGPKVVDSKGLNPFIDRLLSRHQHSNTLPAWSTPPDQLAAQGV